MLEDMPARASSVCLLASSRSDRQVLALLLVRVYCAVLCVRYGGIVKNGGKTGKNNFRKAKKAKKFRKVPQQIILSSAITGRKRLRAGRIYRGCLPQYARSK